MLYKCNDEHNSEIDLNKIIYIKNPLDTANYDMIYIKFSNIRDEKMISFDSRDRDKARKCFNDIVNKVNREVLFMSDRECWFGREKTGGNDMAKTDYDFALGERVVCVDNTGKTGSLTVGKEYVVMSLPFDISCILVKNDNNSLTDYYKTRFKKTDDNCPKFKNGKGGKAMKYIREYFEKHKDALMGLGVVILIDHFIFEGAFREKIKSMVERLLNKTERKLLEVQQEGKKESK